MSNIETPPRLASFYAYSCVQHDDRVQRVIRDVFDERCLQAANKLTDQFLDCGTLQLIEELKLTVVEG
jgi:hypothetical protein